METEIITPEKEPLLSKDDSYELIRFKKKNKCKNWTIGILSVLLVGISIITVSLFTMYNMDKLILTRDQLTTEYYKLENLEKVMKNTLGDVYEENSEENFNNYVITKVINDLAKLEDERWKHYTSFASTKMMSNFWNQFETEADKAEYKSIDESTYYVKWNMFTADNTEVKFKEHINEMKNFDNLIIDLRDNPGGDVSALNELLDYFIDKNKLLYTMKGNDSTEEVLSKHDKSISFKNIIILQNNSSASCSEIFALSLKDNLNNVKIIGDTSYGKGITMNVMSFLDGSGLIYIDKRWYSPNGQFIHNTGINPDILETDVDKQLEKALEICKKN